MHLRVPYGVDVRTGTTCESIFCVITTPEAPSLPSCPCTATPTLAVIVLPVNSVPSELVYEKVIVVVVPVASVGVVGVIVPLLLFVPALTPVILNLFAVTVPVV